MAALGKGQPLDEMPHAVRQGKAPKEFTSKKIATRVPVRHWEGARIIGSGYEKAFVKQHHTDIGRRRFGMWRRWKRFKRQYTYRSTHQCDASSSSSSSAAHDDL
jgi:hypothetical protein